MKEARGRRECFRCIISTFLRYLEQLDTDIDVERMVFRYIIDDIDLKSTYMIYYGAARLLNFLDKNGRIRSLRRRITESSRELGDLVVDAVESLKKMGVKEVLSRIQMLETLIDAWSTNNGNRPRLGSSIMNVLANPLPPLLEPLKVIDHMIHGSTIVYFPGGLSSIWVDEVFIKEVCRRGYKIVLYVYKEPLLLYVSVSDLPRSILREACVTVRYVDELFEDTNSLCDIVGFSDLVLVRDPIVLEYFIDNILFLREHAYASKVMMVFTRPCSLLQRILGISSTKYFIVSGDALHLLQQN